MFGFSFLVFVSVFQLLPVAPYRMIALGGTPASAGWFLGLLTISCAVSAPFTGPVVRSRRSSAVTDHRGQPALADHAQLCVGARQSRPAHHRRGARRRMVGADGGVECVCNCHHSSCTSRRGPGLLGDGVDPGDRHRALARILGLPIRLGRALRRALGTERAHDDGRVPAPGRARRRVGGGFGDRHRGAYFGIEWRVILLAVSLSLISYGYGGLTSFSALFADAIGVMPRSTFLSSMACSVIAARLLVGAGSTPGVRARC